MAPTSPRNGAAGKRGAEPSPSHQTPPSSASIATKRTPGCHRCRERHVKCNKERPVCSTCRQARHTSPCRYEKKHGFRFRQSRYSSGPKIRTFSAQTASQQWDASVTHRYTDSEWNLAATREDGSENFTGRGSTPQPFRQSSLVTRINAFGGTDADFTGFSGTPTNWSRSPNRESQYRPVVPSMPTETSSPKSLWQAADMSSSSPSKGGESLSPVIPEAKSLPPRILDDDLDCKVFEFYIRCVGHWLDIGSTNQYFQRRVPQLALAQPLLLFACLSCAAHIMSLIDEVEKSVEEHYRGKVLELLIPILSSDKATSSNEVLLATTVILRMSEQFEDADDDAQCHLNGAASLLTDGTDWSPVEDSLAVACFWTHLRESIRVCFLREQPCPINLDQLSLARDDMMGTPAGAFDELWTNRITYLLLRTCNLCWGNSEENSGPGLTKLRNLLDSWRRNIPLSFQPWYIREAEDEPFPRLQCFESWHVVAWQFYYTARVMLAVHCADEQRRESLGVFIRHLGVDIIAPTRWLCGLCLSSTANVGTNLNGSHLMAWCGQFLPGKGERKALWEFLHNFGERTGWPVAASCWKLEEAWRGSERPWADC